MRLAADANVLLSSIIGGRAKIVFEQRNVTEVLTAALVFEEVHKYLGRLAKQKGLSEDVLLMTLASLPVVVVDASEYASMIGEAQRRIGKRDPDDVDLLALALHLHIPVWSNDSDFEDADVEWYTTAELLKKLGVT